MAPQDLKQIENLLKEQEARLEKGFATKDDTRKIMNAIEDSRAEIIAAVDEHKADKEEVKELNKRVDKLEQAVFS